MPEILSREESKELIKLCQTGRLYEISNWIEVGKSLQIAPEYKKSILSVAIKTGFHSLVALIAPHESQSTKNQALAHAVSQKRLDLVELLVAHGAEIKSVPLSDVLLCWDPRIIRFFIDNGADIITGSPFAAAFGEKIRTALRAFLDCKRRYPELANSLQEQADSALRKFANDGDLKWVSLLMWAGANPRSSGPKLGDQYEGEPDEEDAEHFQTALEEACYQENVDILKRLKPDPRQDNLSKLLSCASVLARLEIIKYLLGIGAQPNDKANGGSTAIDHCLSHLPHEDFHAWIQKRQVSRWGVRRSMDSLKELVHHGAIWQPNDSYEIDSVRKSLYHADPEVTVELLELFINNKSCSEDTLQQLLRTPRIRQHLKPCEKKLRRLGLDLRTPREKAQEAKTKLEQQIYWLSTRYNRKHLYDEIWSEPVQQVAKKYGLSDVGLAKVCKKLNIPRPGRGYWARKAAGKHMIKRPPLPPVPNSSQQLN